MDCRSNKVMAVSGCLLHQSLMAAKCAVAPGIMKDVTGWCLENDVGLSPWMCPETFAVGLPRKTMGIERYKRTDMQEICAPIAMQFAQYLKRQMDGGILVIGLLGVSFSPACSASRQAYHKNEIGLFILQLSKCIEQLGFSVPIYDINRTQCSEKIKAQLDKTLDMFNS